MWCQVLFFQEEVKIVRKGLLSMIDYAKVREISQKKVTKTNLGCCYCLQNASEQISNHQLYIDFLMI